MYIIAKVRAAYPLSPNRTVKEETSKEKVVFSRKDNLEEYANVGATRTGSSRSQIISPLLSP
jgi:hypothetical protein